MEKDCPIDGTPAAPLPVFERGNWLIDLSLVLYGALEVESFLLLPFRVLK